jgi:hypothetical protein
MRSQIGCLRQRDKYGRELMLEKDWTYKRFNPNYRPEVEPGSIWFYHWGHEPSFLSAPWITFNRIDEYMLSCTEVSR